MTLESQKFWNGEERSAIGLGCFAVLEEAGEEQPLCHAGGKVLCQGLREIPANV